MDKCLRKTGLGMIGDVPWGTHFCQFYSTSEDLLAILVPYFKAGLENNEFCMWVTSEPLGVDEAVKAMRYAMPDFDERMEKGQIEVIPYTRWYKKEGRFDSDEVLAGWAGKLEAALKAGYEGLRLTGNTFWLERPDWNGFKAYEEAVDTVIGSYKMIAICTYSLERCSATDIMDVLSNHSFALIRRGGKWETIESFGRRLIEKKLSESESKYKIVADNAYGWEFWIAPDGRYLYVSPSCERVSGHKPEEFFNDPGLRMRIIAPEDIAAFRSHVVEVEKRIPGELEYRIVLPDGSRRWIGHVCQPVFDSEGRYQGTRGSNLDITDRKLAQEKVSMNEEKYRSLFDSMMNGFGLHEILCSESGAPCDYRFLEVNKAFEELTGLRRESVIGKTALEVLPGLEQYWIETFGKVALTGTPASMENYSKNLGKYYEVVVYSPRKGQFATVFADVTERKRMENELRKAKEDLEMRVEERTAALLKSEAVLAEAQRIARIGSWDWDIINNTLAWSDEIYRIFGLTPQQFAAAYEDFLNSVHPDDRELVINAVNDAISGGKPYSMDHRITLPSGEVRIVHEQADITFDRDRRPVRMLGTVQDVTERRLAEKQLKEAMAELERSNRELENFAYIASHDLKEPLLMVSSYIQLLVRKFRGRLGSEADRYIDSAAKGVLRMERMINDLLEYSRVQTQAKPFYEVDCAELLSQALDNLRVAINESGAEITWGHLPRITADASQLSRVFQNLIGNALKFRKPSEAPRVTVSTLERQGDWLFSVKDNGIGIEAQNKDAVFMLFHRLHEKEYPGTGIGLAVTKRIIERHGGKVWVESEPGKGSTFFFSIPKNPGTNHRLSKAA